MAVTKRELETINEKLQTENNRLRAENARLIDSLTKATERNQQLEEHYRMLREWMIGQT